MYFNKVVYGKIGIFRRKRPLINMAGYINFSKEKKKTKNSESESFLCVVEDCRVFYG